MEQMLRWAQKHFLTVSAVLLAFGVLLGWFVFGISRASPGEIAGAVGSLLGGLVGAVGAVIAVFLAISQQRNEDAAKVRGAVRIEVSTFVKYVIGCLDVCKQIARNEVNFPLTRAIDITKSLPEPVIYPSVADRIGLLPHPNATIEFYMRISEAKAIATALQAMDPVGVPPDFLRRAIVSPAQAQPIADCLITALQLALPIIGHEIEPYEKTQLVAMIQVTMLGKINESLESAKNVFPNAESFNDLTAQTE